MKKYVLAAALFGAACSPAFADEIGVQVGPPGPGPGVTVGEDHTDRTTVIKEPREDQTTVIKKEDEFGNREKTIIHHRGDNDD